MSVSARLTGQERRESIIRAAIELFSERGFRGTTTRELAHACGVSEPTIYQHFPSKQDLYHAIIDTIATRDLRVEEVAQEFISLAQQRDDEAYFRTLAGLILGFYQKHTDFVRLLHFSSLERHELAPMFFERMSRQFLDLVSAYIQQRMDEGAFRAGDPQVAAGFLLGAVDHYAMCQVVFEYKSVTLPPAEEMLDQLVQVFLRGVKA